MKILHICAGWQQWNGAANIARMIMGEQRREGHDVSSTTWASVAKLRAADEVWIHCGWLPCLWWAAVVCFLTRIPRAKRVAEGDALAGVRRRGAECAEKVLKWMPEACYDPVRLGFHSWKKWLAGPIERFCLRRCKTLVATCEAEKGWIQAYLGKRCPPIEVADIKRFFNLNPVDPVNPVKKDLHLLYLGRRHPLKGLSYLETALSTYYNMWSSDPSFPAPTTACTGNPSLEAPTATYYNKCPIEFRVVSDVFGDELERVWDWCDVLVLPTLSENFGLVIAEALERGKRVITTDGAPAWGENLSRVEHVDRVDVSRKERKERKDDSCVDRVEGGMWSGYGGRLIYLKGYRDGTPEDRVRLLKSAIENLLSRASLTPPAAK